MCVCVCVGFLVCTLVGFCVCVHSLVPRRFEDGVLDAVLFSMGRTMTQEEVRQLMQRTVQQVRLTDVALVRVFLGSVR